MFPLSCIDLYYLFSFFGFQMSEDIFIVSHGASTARNVRYFTYRLSDQVSGMTHGFQITKGTVALYWRNKKGLKTHRTLHPTLRNFITLHFLIPPFLIETLLEDNFQPILINLLKRNIKLLVFYYRLIDLAL